VLESQIEIYSLNGEIVSSFVTDPSPSKTTAYNINQLKAGIYFVKAINQNDVFSGKIIVIR